MINKVSKVKEVSSNIADGLNAAVSLVGGFNLTDTKDNTINSFYVAPMGAGSMVVQLENQEGSEQFEVPAAMITAYTGKFLPLRIKSVISSDITSAVVGW